MPHPKVSSDPTKEEEEEEGEDEEKDSSLETSRQSDDDSGGDDDSHGDGDDDLDRKMPATRTRTRNSPSKNGRRSFPRKRAFRNDGDEMEELEAVLIQRAQTAVLDCIVDRLEEKLRTDKGGYHGYSKKVVEVMSPRHPWLTVRMVTTHLAKRRRHKRRKDEAGKGAEEEDRRPRKRGRPSKADVAAKAAATPRKRGRPSKAGASFASKAATTPLKRGSPPKAEASSAAKGASPVKGLEASAESDENNKDKEVVDEEKKDWQANEDRKQEKGDEKSKEEEAKSKPKGPRNPGGRPKGVKTKHRPRGHRILTPEEKYDRDRADLARDHAALEYHKVRHNSEGQRLKKGMLDSIIAKSKKRFGLPDDFKIAPSTILGRIKRGTLVARGTKSPMERVEEELVRLCNERLKTMDRQLFAYEGVEIANSLIKKYGMENEIREFKEKYSYVAKEEDGTTPVESKVCYMGKAYWNQFLKRNGHRLEVRKPGRVGPQTPMVKVEEQLVEIVNGMGRLVRPAEGVRLALTLIAGTEIETELREFKVGTLKNKTAENAKGELLGPGYWRAFQRRNQHLLLYKDEKREEVASVLEEPPGAMETPSGIVELSAGTVDVPTVVQNAADAAVAVNAGAEVAAQANAATVMEAEAADAYAAQAAEVSAAAAAVEAYAAQAAAAAAAGEEGFVPTQPWYNTMQRGVV